MYITLPLDVGDVDLQLKTKMDGNENGRSDDDDNDDVEGVVLSTSGVATGNSDGNETRMTTI